MPGDPAHLEARVVEFLRTRGLLASGTPERAGTHLLVAASGGRDSTVLVHLAAAIARKWRGRLTLATVHHGLREEADVEAAFVASLAREFGAGFLLRRVDVRAELLCHGSTLQDAARRLRYAALEEMRTEAAADVILTAHHAHDQAETLLGHFLRGAGPDGLGGIRPVQGRVARPLLDVTGDSIEAFARANGIDWLEDSSNATDDYRRNAIRHRISPAVTSVFGPGWVSALGEHARFYRMLAAHLQERETAWDAMVEDQAENVLVRGISLNGSSEFEKLSVCRQALRRLGVSAPSLRDCLTLLDLSADTAGSSRQLTGDIEAMRTRDGLVVFARAAQPAESVAGPGMRVRWGAWTLAAEELPADGPSDGTPPGPSLPTADPFEEIVDLDAVGTRWRLRRWTADDRFEPFGFGREKAVGAFLADQGVRMPFRSRIPVLDGAQGIFWVCGVRLAQHAAVHAGSRRLCRLHYSINDRDTA